MATSGSRDFNLDVAEVIEEAYERCGLEVRTGYDARTARRSLNLMFADWANRGLNLWTVASGTVTLIGRGDYVTLPDKTTQGRPSQFWFNRQIAPVINLWAVPENSTDQIVYYYVQRIEDADSLVNTTDMPFRFYPCMVAGLAYYIAMKRAPERLQVLKTIYEEEFLRAAEEDEQRVSLKLQPSASYLRV